MIQSEPVIVNQCCPSDCEGNKRNLGHINPQEHPVGTRLLYMQITTSGRVWGCCEATIVEWSPGGYVKIRRTEVEGETWLEWFKPQEIEVLEILESK